MSMHTLTFRLSNEDHRNLERIVNEMQESTSVDLTSSDVLRMLIREEVRRRQSYGPHLLRDVICTRTHDGKAVVTGVTHDWVVHSPGGFDWGYSGNGPLELALNVLLYATGNRRFAGKHCLRFRDEVVGRIPLSGGVLRAREVLEWVARFSDDDRARDAVAGRKESEEPGS